MGGGKRPPMEEEEEETYEMEDIIEYRWEKNQDFFRVKWKDYPLSEATWEPRANILMPGDELERKMDKLKAEAREEKERRERPVVSAPAPAPPPPVIPEADVPSNAAAAAPAAEPTTKKRRRADSVVITKPVVVPAPTAEDTTTAESAVTDQTAQTSAAVSAGVNVNEKAIATTDHYVRRIPSLETVETVRELPEEKYPRVHHVSQKSDGKLQCFVARNALKEGEWRPLEEVRKEYKDELLDYLLARVRFNKTQQQQPTPPAY